MAKKFIPLLLVLGASWLHAQQRPLKHPFEIGIIVGGMNYAGDVASKDIHVEETKLAVGAIARFHLTRHFYLRGHYLAGTICGDDNNSEYRQFRQLRFSSFIQEAALMVEYAPLAIGNRARYRSEFPFMSPYLFIGGGYTFVSPEPVYYGPVSEEGTYIQHGLPEPGGGDQQLFSMPFGLGMRLEFSPRWLIGFEGMFHPVFNDYLDGISMNGDPANNDWFVSVNVTATYCFSYENRRRIRGFW